MDNNELYDEVFRLRNLIKTYVFARGDYEHELAWSALVAEATKTEKDDEPKQTD